MFYLAILLQWLHVLFAIAWFGASIFVTFMVVPIARRLPDQSAHDYFAAFAPRARRYFAIVAGITILLGLLRGLVLGLTLPSPYAITFIAASVLGIAQAAFGARVTSPTVDRVAATPPGPEFTAGLDRAARWGRVELAGFLVLITLMIAMRFGY